MNSFPSPTFCAFEPPHPAHIEQEGIGLHRLEGGEIKEFVAEFYSHHGVALTASLQITEALAL